LEYLDFTIEYIDAPQKGDGVGVIVKEFIRPFDLSKAPLLRIGLVEVSTDDYLLMFDMHHIISDGTSLTILPREFIKLYQGEELTPLRLQYKDFSLWQNTRQQRTILEQQGIFWLNQFQGKIPVLNLPADYARPLNRSYAGSTFSIWIPQEEIQKLKKLAVEEDVTLFMVMLTLYNILLAKITGQEDIVVGTGMANR
ncbi:MAG: hypothetical protein GY940_34050, partial [bacterium]|nr:hypothetical protein [bacterium]